MKSRIIRIIALSVCAAAFNAAAHAQLRVTYPYVEERADNDYGYRVLALALKKSDAVFSLELSPSRVNMDRAKILLDRGDISVIDFGTSPEFEERWDAVYFPIDRGLSGYRMLLVNTALESAFAGIKDLPSLRRYVAGQGAGWSDVAVLKNAGIQVVEVPLFESLFRMVNAQRFDFLPLGIEEISMFRDRYPDLLTDSLIEPTLAIHYPFARLFFVRKGNEELVQTLQTGLERAWRDGSFIRLFEEDASISKAVSACNLGKRTIIHLENPNLTDRFGRIPTQYFWTPR